MKMHLPMLLGSAYDLQNLAFPVLVIVPQKGLVSRNNPELSNRQAAHTLFLHAQLKHFLIGFI